jgi:type II secretory pathway pseudopilin PulG
MNNRQSKVKSQKSKVYRLNSSVCGHLFRLSTSDFRLFKKSSASPRAAFTLIELLVAMGLLMIIVLMLANLFQQSTRAWDSGMRQAEVGLEARAAINTLQQDLSRAVCATNEMFNPLTFDMLTDSGPGGSAIQSVSYAGGGSKITRSFDGTTVDLVRGVDVVFDVKPQWVDGKERPGLPDYVDISLSMTSNRDNSEVRVYVADRAHDKTGIRPVDVIDTTSGD